jgi:hypothetical protein
MRRSEQLKPMTPLVRMPTELRTPALHGRFLGVRILARALSVGGSVLVVACSSNGTTPDAADSGSEAQGGDPTSCGAPADTYVANFVKQGTRGKYTFTLVEGTPAPPDLDGNTWTMKIVDATGASPTLAQVGVTPFMPQMGHGSDQTPQIAANADGTFALSNIYLFMPGLWTITVAVNEPVATGDAGTTTHAPISIDDAVYTFCLN